MKGTFNRKHAESVVKRPCTHNHLTVLMTLSARRALRARNTLNTLNILASNTPMFWTMSGMRKSTILARTMAKSEVKIRAQNT